MIRLNTEQLLQLVEFCIITTMTIGELWALINSEFQNHCFLCQNYLLAATLQLQQLATISPFFDTKGTLSQLVTGILNSVCLSCPDLQGPVDQSQNSLGIVVPEKQYIPCLSLPLLFFTVTLLKDFRSPYTSDSGSHLYSMV